MKFTDIKKEEVLKHISDYQYKSILSGKATHKTKFNLWITYVENGQIDPLKNTLPKFYK